MVKYFSVDWLAQSHHNAARTEDQGAGMDTAPTCRPHIPCVVQPRPPAFGKSYLQPKPKASKPVEHVEQQDSNLCSPLHPTSCASPSKWPKLLTFKRQFSPEARAMLVTSVFFLFTVSEVSGYSSGYESEAASSECLSVDEGGEMEKDGQQRRVRTKFTPEQISKLEKIFNKHKYLDAGEREKTAQKLSLTATQVRGDPQRELGFKMKMFVR